MAQTFAVCTVKTPDGGQRNCQKHVDFYSKNKFEILVHLVGFNIRIYHDTRSPERQIGEENEVWKLSDYAAWVAISYQFAYIQLRNYCL